MQSGVPRRRLHEQYAALKRDVFARHADDMFAYNDSKDAWIKALEPTAIAWYRAIQAGAGTAATYETIAPLVTPVA